jgi:hypothetical protein
MRKTVTVNGTQYHIITNGHLRPLVGLAELPQEVRETEFDYADDQDFEEWTPRFFNYRGSWYDTHEFERAGNDIARLGYDDYQTESYFNCVAIGYFDPDGYAYDSAVRVAFIHW